MKKKTAILVALALLLTTAVAGTVAFLVTSTEPVVNTFTPGGVTTKVLEELDGTTKRNVRIQNTGNIPAYIRATFLVNWVDSNGNIYSTAPVEGEGYDVVMGSDWVKLGNYYYYQEVVPAGGATTKLIDSIAPKANAAPEGYTLQVTIIAEGIQAEGLSSDGKTTPIQEAWGVNPSTWPTTNG